MKSLTEKDIKEKIEEITQERAKYAEQANQQMAAFNGAIQALEMLIAPPEETEEEKENESPNTKN